MSPTTRETQIATFTGEEWKVTGEEWKARQVICKIVRLGYAPSFDRWTIACEDSDGRWRHLAFGICWLTKPNPVIR